MAVVEDSALLQRYAKTQDPHAFTELVNRYAGLVHGTCLRITANPHDAEDVTQQCFMELAKRSGSITSSLSGWLHSLAASRSKNAIRGAVRRKLHEEAAIDGIEPQQKDATWEDIAPLVDEALGELPADLSAPLVLHYLEGRTQSEIAKELGMNQSTVSRHLKSGVCELRNRLKKSGAIVSVAMLATMLSTSVSSAAPAAVVTALGKMAMAGVGAGVGKGAAGTVAGGFFGTVAGEITVVAAVVGTIIGGAAIHKKMTEPAPAPDPTPIVAPATTTTAPEPPPVATRGITLQERIDQLTIPKIEFMATPIVEAVEFLRKASAEHDDPALPARERGVNILLDISAASSPRITFTAHNITLEEAIRMVTQISGLTYRVEENAVRILSRSTDK
jgi:RNA polymerase sigma factor (sigma-70 family)